MSRLVLSPFSHFFPTLIRGVARATAHRSPATAAILYNKGGTLARNYDKPDLMMRALEQLELANEIYMENGRVREAGYAMTSSAEAYLKLGNSEKVKECLELARGRLDKRLDRTALEACKRTEARLKDQQEAK